MQNTVMKRKCVMKTIHPSGLSGIGKLEQLQLFIGECLITCQHIREQGSGQQEKMGLSTARSFLVRTIPHMSFFQGTRCNVRSAGHNACSRIMSWYSEKRKELMDFLSRDSFQKKSAPLR